jgi:hypothetical protein
MKHDLLIPVIEGRHEAREYLVADHPIHRHSVGRAEALCDWQHDKGLVGDQCVPDLKRFDHCETRG